MIVGVLTLQVSVFDAMTLKDKRRVIKSLKDRIANKFNASIAEVGLMECFIVTFARRARIPVNCSRCGLNVSELLCGCR